MGQEINEVTGTVLAIEAVSAVYALEEPDCEMFASVDGSARGMPIRGTDLWDREPETWHPENGGRKFAGYLVRLETATVLGTSVDAVKGRQSRALLALSRRLAG